MAEILSLSKRRLSAILKSSTCAIEAKGIMKRGSLLEVCRQGDPKFTGELGVPPRKQNHNPLILSH